MSTPKRVSRASPVAQTVNNPPAMWETWSLGWEDPLEEGWQPTPVFLPGESPWTEMPGRLQSLGSQRIRHNWVTKHSTPAQHIYFREVFYFVLNYGPLASLVAQTVKRLPAVRKTWDRSLGRKDPWEKEMATHSGTLTWKIPWTEKPGSLQSMGSQRVGNDWATSLTLWPVDSVLYFLNPEKS